MASIFLDFEWMRPKRQGGARLVDEHEKQMPDTRAGAFLIRQGELALVPLTIVWDEVGEVERYRPLEKYPTLHLVLSKVETPAEALAFCNRFGPLTLEQVGDDMDFAPVPVPEILRLAHACRGFMKTATLADTDLIASSGFNVPATLGLAKAGKGLKVTARLWSLGAAILLHMVMSHMDGNIWRLCEYQECGKAFKVGPGSKPKRRFDARHCSETCQNNQKNLNRSKGK